MRETIDIAGLKIDLVSKADAIKKISNFVSAQGNYVVTKPYVEFSVLAQTNPEVLKMLNQSDLSLADGVSLLWAASYLYDKPQRTSFAYLLYTIVVKLQNRHWLAKFIPEKMAGTNFTIPLIKEAQKKGWKIGIIGGPKDTTTTSATLVQKFPNLYIGGVWSGHYQKKDEAALVENIAQAKLDLLFVAMGFPKQEKFITDNKDKLKAKALIGEGGSFDYDVLGGHLKKAPKFIQNLGLEWFWRLILQPWRFRRQTAIFKFVWLIYKHKKQLKAVNR